MVEALTGKWVEDVSKRQLGSAPPLRFQKNAKGELEEELGPPGQFYYQPVVLDGKPHATGKGDTTVVWKQTAPGHYESRLLIAGKLNTTRKIEISADGKTLAEVSDVLLPDGKTDSNKPVYRRATGTGTALEGLWKMVSDGSVPDVLTILAVGPNGIKITDLSGETSTHTLDGKPSTVIGPRAPNVATRALRIKDSRTLEDTVAMNGAAIGTGTMQLSPDGKTLLSTITVSGVKADASVQVFVKQ